eukprot:UC4_evm3s1514
MAPKLRRDMVLKGVDRGSFEDRRHRSEHDETVAEAIGEREIFIRSVGGDEMNVAVALAKFNSESVTSCWISVLPEGPMGDVVADCATRKGLDIRYVKRVPNSDVGTFTVLPEHRTVHYQRRNAAFACHDPKIFDWDMIMKTESEKGQVYMHMTGITPLISNSSLLSWKNAMEAAHRHDAAIFVDFNHRKQLGTLGQLWSYILPEIKKLEMLILSVGSLKELAELHGMGNIVPGVDATLETKKWLDLIAEFRKKWCIRRLSVCFKSRDKFGLQKRWSVMSTENGIYSTIDTPIFHVPRDECGGGSAWAAGIMHYFHTFGLEDVEISKALRHGDLLAALCQETVGDHSQVTKEMFDRVAQLGKKSDGTLQACNLKEVLNFNNEKIDRTASLLRNAGVIAILRARNDQMALQRGLELGELGVRAIEVTLDSKNWKWILKNLAEKLPGVCVGVGTVMDDDICEISQIAELGGKFALSPINPSGFLEECHKYGIVGIPSGLSSNELWSLHKKGARLIKMFHAGLVGPKILKSMMGVSPLSAMSICPSGGVSPENAEEWWNAGAVAIGMGSNLAGQEIKYQFGTSEFAEAEDQWKNTGLPAAIDLFK